MVSGLEIFQTHFASFKDSYVLIGGCACELNLRTIDAPFRTTKDIDMVLLVEALAPDFVAHFWRFIKAGGYQMRETSTGEKKFYRFQKPTSRDYPLMIELFSRHPDFTLAGEDVRLTPIPSEDECSSLSAILLDDDYYKLIHENTIEVNGLQIVSPWALIVLKAKAWMDLSARKKSGEAIDSSDIRKHKKDIARLSVLLDENFIKLPTKINEEMKVFLDEFRMEKIDTKALGLILTEDEIKALLQNLAI